jgi:hypothetical protein
MLRNSRSSWRTPYFSSSAKDLDLTLRVHVVDAGAAVGGDHFEFVRLHLEQAGDERAAALFQVAEHANFVLKTFAGMAKYKLEYIWLDGYQPLASLRSKTQIKEFASFPKLEELPAVGLRRQLDPCRPRARARIAC